MADAAKALLREIPHIIVLVVLIVILLVVLTKFNWVHCSQIPGNWCDIYCDWIMRSHSRVALVYGGDGIGNPEELLNFIRTNRPNTVLEPIELGALDIKLTRYDLVILEGVRSISFKQSRALREYLNKGGMLLWIGDSAANHYIDQIDLTDTIARTPENEFQKVGLNKSDIQRLTDREMTVAEIQNLTTLLKEKGFFAGIKKWKGFGPLEDVLLAKYVDTKKVLPGEKVLLKIVSRDHLIARGVMWEFQMSPPNFVEVREHPAGVEKIAFIKYKGKDYPAIYETRYAGRIVYVSFPLEDANSTTLVTNILDYLVPC